VSLPGSSTLAYDTHVSGSACASFARQRLRGHLALARISNSPTVISDAVAGAALADARGPIVITALVALAMVLFYTAGMYLNDLWDYAIDCRQRPERPLPAGLVSRSVAAAMVVVLFVAGGSVLWSVGRRAFVSGLVLIALIAIYDRWHKEYALSPLIMAACRFMVYLTAFLALSSRVSATVVIPAGMLALYVAGLTYVARGEHSLSMSNAGLVALLFLPVLYDATRPMPLETLPLLLGFVAWVAYSVSFVYRRTRQIGRAVGHLIAGISLVDGLVLAMTGATPGVVMALATFSLTLLLQRYVKGT